ncbi:TIGR03620 family F420-dependent LLM class oxidoreductase [Amycolatopsis sp.]|jgi:probable F420-dependent oxidoreductase|uniref:TIGR03620 family F420-dependent LLM class oxidoreductase n=1 Tax=Amycolatopsis sp. TaxID=37632 RepID=UPI002DFC3420|nr:TIGR03620 family F420-dependent LLM class oxidoreductase [Amycolatopsis sp.]
MNTVIAAARQALGPVGVCLPVSFTSALSVDLQREAVGRLERAGYRAVWTNEVIGGKDAFVQLAVLLAATDRMVFGTSIANIWAREPQTAHGAAALLAQAYPGRFVLGLGVGYPEQAAGTGRDFGNPLTTIRDYLDRMGSPTWPPAPDVAYPRIIAANGPKMLALAGEIADGALPAMLPPEVTAQARQALGPDKLLVVGLSVVADSDRDRAKATAREKVSDMLGRPSYAAAIARLGYSDQELAEVDDRLVNAIVGLGAPAAIAAKVREHLVAGADHVTLMLPIGGDFTEGVDELEQLAPALADVT